MLTVGLFSRILAALAMVFAGWAFGQKLSAFSKLARPADRSNPKGNTQAGILYAYTLGMAPWAKESTRLHAIAYLRGVAFHIGIFLGLGVLVASPWIGYSPLGVRLVLGTVLAFGAIFGLIGFVARFVETNLKALSNPDDYFAVFIVSLFLGAAALWLFLPQTQAAFYLVSAIMLVYAPLGKIRHCIYFAYSRLFYGKFMGSRAVLPHSQQGAR